MSFTNEPISFDNSIDGMIFALSVFSILRRLNPNYPWDITNHRQLSLILENGLLLPENVDSNVSSAVNALMRAPLFTMFSIYMMYLQTPNHMQKYMKEYYRV